MYRVLKFGGSSVASATNVSRVLDIVEQEAQKGCVILVSSAISGCTDALLSGDPAQYREMEQRHADKAHGDRFTDVYLTGPAELIAYKTR